MFDESRKQDTSAAESARLHRTAPCGRYSGMHWVVLLVGAAIASLPLAAALLFRARVLLTLVALVLTASGLAAVGLYIAVYLELGGDSSLPTNLATLALGSVALALAVFRVRSLSRAAAHEAQA